MTGDFDDVGIRRGRRPVGIAMVGSEARVPKDANEVVDGTEEPSERRSRNNLDCETR